MGMEAMSDVKRYWPQEIAEQFGSTRFVMADDYDALRQQLNGIHSDCHKKLAADGVCCYGAHSQIITDLEQQLEDIRRGRDVDGYIDQVRALKQQLERAQQQVEQLQATNQDLMDNADDQWKHRAEQAEARVKELEMQQYRNNRVACVGCKKPVDVTALNAIRCESCKSPGFGTESWK